MQCKVPGCQKIAAKTWALVPVCCRCWDALKSEQLLYYSKRIKDEERVLLAQIRDMTPWPNEEQQTGQEKVKRVMAVVRKVNKGIVTVYDIEGRRYRLDHGSTFKGANTK